MVVALVVGLTHVDVGAALGALGSADPEMLAAAVALYALGQTISGAMWAVSQGSGGVRGISLGRLIGMHWMARAACESLPASMGEAVRVAVVRRHPAGARAGVARIAGGVVGYKLLDAVVTGVVILALLLVVPVPGVAGPMRASALAILALAVVALLVWRFGTCVSLPGRIPRRVADALGGVVSGASVLRDPAGARAAVGLALGALVARALSLMALLIALGAPAQAALLALCLITLAGVLPGAPGGAGARELLMVPALVAAHGISASTALAFSVAVQAIALGTSLAIGAAAACWLGRSLWSREWPGPAGEPAPGPRPVSAPSAPFSA